MYQAGLVLEGGGMRGLYTAGVLDFFLDKDIMFSHIYGVSAGACHMTSYIAGQRGRAKDVNLDYLFTNKYCSVQSLLTTGDLFNVSTAYDLIPKYLNPFDYEAYRRYEGKAYAVATDIKTGEPKYFRIRDVEKDMVCIRASASLPLVSRNVKIGDGYYLDGGITDAVPIRKSMLDGNKKNVIVLTKEEGYVRKPDSHIGLMRAAYLAYPKVPEKMAQRYRTYNETMAFIEEQKALGKVFVLRPKEAGNVGRIEKDQEKLNALYEEGYRDAKEHYEALIQYLES